MSKYFLSISFAVSISTVTASDFNTHTQATATATAIEVTTYQDQQTTADDITDIIEQARSTFKIPSFKSLPASPITSRGTNFPHEGLPIFQKSEEKPSYQLPKELDPFVTIVGTTGNITLTFTPEEYNQYKDFLIGLPHISFYLRKTS